MKILLASKIDTGALEILSQRHDVVSGVGETEAALKNLIRDREALIFRSGVNITAGIMACAPDLQLLIRAGSGLDNVDLDYLRNHDLKLVRIPQPGARAVAELAFGMMLALSRQILVADQLLRKGTWAKHQLRGHLLVNKQLGIVGLGNIGTLLGQMGLAWGMQVLGCVEHPSPERAAQFEAKGLHLTDLNTVLSTADYLCVCVPLKTTTSGLIGHDELAMVKPGSFVLNMARGGIIDEAALSEALRQGRLAGAALDVHQTEGENQISPLADLPNVVLTPHIGAMTIDSQREIGRRIIDIMDDFDPAEQTPGGSAPGTGHPL
ncbi:D-3-phosphoglycerate dehydrogenase-related protein [Syntrophotalea carbinolica DSM 2380]|uniref:D-3-phosphoglycerate dehydrogenase-related protein n=1 Tax=Syntrophotalea carbinolica (strain DSM 2380 / NBRC 103641 / GraBd1) TaxID=338963 RepID=Q3A6W9_SYNC1|nr:3-phosphoglycerate dehydrogenase [Syntrophotalea carbinolica]ABA87888.1 D-3-phosphoglycerate dehydrogenase-related protein [Syntrophotalea carbinolica DSM 2380]